MCVFNEICLSHRTELEAIAFLYDCVGSVIIVCEQTIGISIVTVTLTAV